MRHGELKNDNVIEKNGKIWRKNVRRQLEQL
jgi:hypothetical protein